MTTATVEESDNLLPVGWYVGMETLGAKSSHWLCQVYETILSLEDVMEELLLGEGICVVVDRGGVNKRLEGLYIRKLLDDEDAEFCWERFERHDCRQHIGQ